MALELGDPVKALRSAGRIDVEELPTASRRADVLIDVAHAYSLHHNDAYAAGELVKAERHAPEIVRYSVKAHERVRVCLGRERKGRTPGLRELAERLKVTV